MQNKMKCFNDKTQAAPKNILLKDKKVAQEKKKS